MKVFPSYRYASFSVLSAEFTWSGRTALYKKSFLLVSQFGGQDSTPMGRIFQPLLFMLARCTRNELIRHIEFLKSENEMLRKRIPKKHFWFTPEEKQRLLKLALAIGPDVKHLISIVSYDAIRRWKRQAYGFVTKKRGRPKTPAEVRELVRKIAQETGWGYTRILGELKKLGIDYVSRQTVVTSSKRRATNPVPSRALERGTSS